jgi:hypothetical protein
MYRDKDWDTSLTTAHRYNGYRGIVLDVITKLRSERHIVYVSLQGAQGE